MYNNHFERVCKIESRQLTREIGRERHRVVHKTCQVTEEAEVSKDFIW